MKPSLGSIYIIRWHDASFNSDQGDGAEAAIGILCDSVGFLVASNKNGIRLAMEKDADTEAEKNPDGGYRFFMDIPRKMILKMTKVGK